MKIEIKKCDGCGLEERSDESTHWSMAHSGTIVLNLRSAPGCQIDFTKDHLCYGCYMLLSENLSDLFTYLKTSREELNL